MSAPAVPLASGHPNSVARPRPWVPALADFYLAILLYWSFAAAPEGWARLLGDADTGFHIRAGDAIRAAGSVPHQHLFSYGAPGGHWYAFEWLSEVLFSWIHASWGLAGVAWLSGLVLGAALLLVAIRSVRAGSGGLIAIPAGLIAASATSVHFLARPHVFTLLLLAGTALLADADRRHRTRAVWLLVPGFAVWANLHAAFLVGIAYLGLLALAFGLESCLWPELRSERRALAIRYGMLAAASGMASLLNPYGVQLPLHLVKTLRTSWYFELVDEFKAPDFHSEAHLSFLLLLFAGLLLAGSLIRRRNLADALVIAAFGFLGITAVRNLPLFTVLATPIVAAEASALLHGWAGGKQRSTFAGAIDDLNERLRGGLATPTAWAVVFSVLFVAAGASNRFAFPAKDFPTSMVARHSEELAQRRVFSSDQWANYLIYVNAPRQRVLLDSQHHAYSEALLRSALAAMSGGKDWREFLDRTKTDAVLCPSSSALATLLRSGLALDWQIADEDSLAVLAYRSNPTRP